MMTMENDSVERRQSQPTIHGLESTSAQDHLRYANGRSNGNALGESYRAAQASAASWL